MTTPKPKKPSEAHDRAGELKRQREARLRAQRSATRNRAILIASVVLVVLGGCVGLYSSPLLPVRTVEVVGNVHITAAQVRSLAQVPSNATLIRFPAADVAKRVAAAPWVADVTVSRVFPAGMRIRVTERVPVAIVDAVDTMWLADGAGMVIAKPTTETSETLPVIRDVPGLDLKAGRRTTSEVLLNALHVLTGIDPALAKRVRGVSATSIDETTLVLDDRVELVIGQAADLGVKSRLVQQILKDQGAKVVSIDVRVTDRPTWRGLK